MITVSEIRPQIRAFLAEEMSSGRFKPRCDAWLSGHDPAFSRRLGEHGWIGMTWPKRYGGGERSYLERYVVLEELLGAGAPVAAHWIADRQTGPLLLRYGTDGQKESLLPRIARGELYFCIGMSEPDAGSDLASIRTKAVPVEGGFMLSGTKVWTSHAHRSHYILTLARSSPKTEARHEGISQLIVDLHGKGVSVRPIKLLTGEEDFSEVVFDEVFVSEEMVLGKAGEGWRQVMSELSYERSGPERFLSTYPLLVELVREVGPNPTDGESRALGELYARLAALRELSMEVARSLEAGKLPTIQAAMVKDMGTRFERDVVETTRRLVEPSKGSGEFRRLYAEAVTHVPGFTLRGGTSEILRGIIARELHA